jgi:hypothetical protein
VPDERPLYFPFDNSEGEVLRKLIDHYVPYRKCYRHCSASSICKYAQKERKCEPQQMAIRHFFRFVGTEVNIYQAGITKAFIEAAVVYAELVYLCYSYAGFAIDEASFGWWRTRYLKTPLFLSSGLKKQIDLFHSCIARLAPTAASRRVLIVEGKSEEIIGKALAKNLYIDEIYNLQGIGNVSHLRTFLPNLRERGERIFVLLDGDGSQRAIQEIRRLRRDGILARGGAYVFKKALEDSFPTDILRRAFIAALPAAYHSFVDDSIQLSKTSKTRTFAGALRKLLYASPVVPRDNIDQFISRTKLKAAEFFAEYLYGLLYRPAETPSDAYRALGKMRRFFFR